MGRQSESRDALRRLTPRVAPLPELGGDALQWADRHFDAAVLIHGDAAEPLVRRSAFWVARGPDRVLGLASRFEGFEMPAVAACAETGEALEALVRRAAPDRPFLLGLSEDQPWTPGRRVAATDPWMIAPCARLGGGGSAERIDDGAEIADFFGRQGAAFWSDASHRAGDCFGVRDEAGALVSAGALSFLVERHSYGHIGPVVTRRDCRGRGYAGRILASLARRISELGAERCGLFADAADLGLPSLYARYGFERSGGFRFVVCRGGGD
jgi:GNAT superfamily N-acetyltransferase